MCSKIHLLGLKLGSEVQLPTFNNTLFSDFPGGLDSKASAYNAGDLGSIPGSGRSLGEGNGNPLQYSYLENSIDRGAWWASVHGVAKESDTMKQMNMGISLTLLFPFKKNNNNTYLFGCSVQFSSVAQSCPTLCDPMNHSMPDLPVHHQLPEFTQTHVHRVSDAIKPSHPLSSPSPPAPNPSQHQSLFQ